jgi:hypothetical protein
MMLLPVAGVAVAAITPPPMSAAAILSMDTNVDIALLIIGGCWFQDQQSFVQVGTDHVAGNKVDRRCANVRFHAVFAQTARRRGWNNIIICFFNRRRSRSRAK